jgi:hypothetical protein
MTRVKAVPPAQQTGGQVVPAPPKNNSSILSGIMCPFFRKDSSTNSWNLLLGGSASGTTCESRVITHVKDDNLPLDIEQL